MYQKYCPRECFVCVTIVFLQYTYQLGNFLVLVKKGLIRQLYGNFYGLVFTLKNKTLVNHLLVQVNLFLFILKIYYLCILLYSGCIIVKHISHTIFNQSSLRAIIHHDYTWYAPVDSHSQVVNAKDLSNPNLDFYSLYFQDHQQGSKLTYLFEVWVPFLKKIW